MTTPKFICGAECGIAVTGTASAGTEHWSSAGANASVQVGGGKVAGAWSARSFKFNPSASKTDNLVHTFASAIASPGVMVARFRVMFDVLPNSLRTIFGGVGSSAMGGIYFNNTTGRLTAWAGNASPGTGVGPVISTGVWYCVDVRITRNTTYTVEWNVDGAAQNTATKTGMTAGTITGCYLGFSTGDMGLLGGDTTTATYYIDDVMVGGTTGDFPFGPGQVVGLYPNGDKTNNQANATPENIGTNSNGGHFYSATTDFGKGSSGGTAVGAQNVESTSWQSLDKPLNTTASGNMIKCASSVSTEWMAWTFDDLPAEAGAVNGCMVVVATHSATASANTQSMTMTYGTSGVNVYNALDVSETTITLPVVTIASAPGGGGWSKAVVDGIGIRWGGSNDSSPTPFLDGICLEVDYIPSISLALTPVTVGIAEQLLTIPVPLPAKLYLVSTLNVEGPEGVNANYDYSATLPVGTLNKQAVGIYVASLVGSAAAAQATRAAATLAQTAHQDIWIGRWTSRRMLDPGTFGAGDWTFGFAAAEASGVHAQTILSLYVYRPSTNSIVGFIYDSDAPLGSEFATSETGRVVTFTGTDVTAQDDDVLILEWWLHVTQDAAAISSVNGYYSGTTEPTDGAAASSSATYLALPVSGASIALDPVVVNIAEQTLDRTLGLTSVALLPVAVDIAEQVLGRTLGLTSLALLPVSVDIAEQPLDRTVGAVTPALTPLSVPLTPIVLGISAAGGTPASLVLTPITLDIAEQTISATYGAATPALSPVVIDIAEQVIARTLGLTSVALLPVTVDITEVALGRVAAISLAVGPVAVDIVEQAVARTAAISLAVSPVTVDIAEQTVGRTAAISLAVSPVAVDVVEQTVGATFGATTIALSPVVLPLVPVGVGTTQAQLLTLGVVSVAVAGAALNAAAGDASIALPSVSVSVTLVTLAATGAVSLPIVQAGASSAGLNMDGTDPFVDGAWVRWPVNVKNGDTITFEVIDGFAPGNGTHNHVISGIFLGGPDGAPYGERDDAVQGSWIGHYGADGYVYRDGSTDYNTLTNCTFAHTGNSFSGWGRNDAACLELVGGGGRNSSCWFDWSNQPPLVLTLTFTADYVGSVAIYSLDSDNGPRRQQITISGNGVSSLDLNVAPQTLGITNVANAIDLTLSPVAVSVAPQAVGRTAAAAPALSPVSVSAAAQIVGRTAVAALSVAPVSMGAVPQVVGRTAVATPAALPVAIPLTPIVLGRTAGAVTAALTPVAVAAAPVTLVASSAVSLALLPVSVVTALPLLGITKSQTAALSPVSVSVVPQTLNRVTPVAVAVSPTTLPLTPILLGRTAAISLALSPVAVSAVELVLGEVSGAVSVGLSPVAVPVTSVALGRSVGGVAPALLPTSDAVAVQQVGRTVGAVSIGLTPVTVSTGPPVISITQATLIAASPVTVSVSTVAIGRTVGATSAAVAPVVLTVVPVAIGTSQSQVVTLNPVTVSLTGSPVATAVGGAAAALPSVTVSIAPVALGRSAAVSVGVSPASVAVSPPAVVVAAASSLVVSPAVVVVQSAAVAVAPGATAVALTPASVSVVLVVIGAQEALPIILATSPVVLVVVEQVLVRQAAVSMQAAPVAVTCTGVSLGIECKRVLNYDYAVGAPRHGWHAQLRHGWGTGALRHGWRGGAAHGEVKVNKPFGRWRRR